MYVPGLAVFILVPSGSVYTRTNTHTHAHALEHAHYLNNDVTYSPVTAGSHGDVPGDKTADPVLIPVLRGLNPQPSSWAGSTAHYPTTIVMEGFRHGVSLFHPLSFPLTHSITPSLRQTLTHSHTHTHTHTQIRANTLIHTHKRARTHTDTLPRSLSSSEGCVG